MRATRASLNASDRSYCIWATPCATHRNRVAAPGFTATRGESKEDPVHAPAGSSAMTRTMAAWTAAPDTSGWRAWARPVCRVQHRDYIS